MESRSTSVGIDGARVVVRKFLEKSGVTSENFRDTRNFRSKKISVNTDL
jgi:hypothetical protein